MATAWKPRNGEPKSALGDLRLLDISGVGAYAAMILADFGADVIRVAPAATAARKITTGSRLDPHGQLDSTRAAAFNALHRGQRSIALDLKDSDGQKIFHQLAVEADVVLESFRPGVMERLGVGYASLSAANPGLVYCSLSGYGQTGPYRDLPGHDINYIALGGLLGLTRRPGTPPVMPINVGADFAGGGLYAALAILIALHARERTGAGQHIDMAMCDGVLSLLTAAFIGYFADGEDIRPGEYALNGGAPWYEVYECADGKWIALGCIEPHFFEALCRVLDLADLRERQFHPGSYQEIRRRFAAALAEKSASEWMKVFERQGVAASPVLGMRDIPSHPQVLARRMVITTDSAVGPAKQIGVAPKLSVTPGEPRGSPPQPGRDTRAILEALGLGPDVITQLLERGAVSEPAGHIHQRRART